MDLPPVTAFGHDAHGVQIAIDRKAEAEVAVVDLAGAEEEAPLLDKHGSAAGPGPRRASRARRRGMCTRLGVLLAEGGVGLGELSKAFRGVRKDAAIGMQLKGKAPICLADFVTRCGLGDAEDDVRI